MPEPDLQALLRAGITAAKAGQREQARQSLLRVIEQDEASIPAWLWLSTVLDDREERRICLENVLILDPDNAHARAGLLRLDQAPKEDRGQETGDRRLSPATELSSQAHPVEPKLPVTSSPSRRYQRLQPQPPGNGCPFCRKPIPTTASLCPHCQLPLVMACPACGAETDVEQLACPRCGQTMGNYRRKVSYFSSLAAAYQANNHPEDSLKAWQAIETLQPGYPNLHLRLGEAQLAAGRPDRAMRHFEQALAETPNSPELHYALAEFQRQRGERQEAFTAYLKVTQLDPKHGLAWLRLGQLYEGARRSQDAGESYRRAAALLPADSDEGRLAQQQLQLLRPSLPSAMATGWSELLRQMTGPVVICLLAVLLDAGLRPWWISWSGWLALLLAPLGAFLWVSGTSLPQNPLIRPLLGDDNAAAEPRLPVAILGAGLWLLSFGLILLPLAGQSFPRPPSL
jgi:tetratricopeptide (TPR) repeat protein